MLSALQRSSIKQLKSLDFSINQTVHVDNRRVLGDVFTTTRQLVIAMRVLTGHNERRTVRIG